MNKQRKKHKGTSEGASADALPLFNPEWADPPRRSPFFLSAAMAVFAAWLGFLIWLALAT